MARYVSLTPRETCIMIERKYCLISPKIIGTAYDRAVEILNSNMEKLHAVANVLLEKETIDGEEFLNIMNS